MGQSLLLIGWQAGLLSIQVLITLGNTILQLRKQMEGEKYLDVTPHIRAGILHRRIRIPGARK
jgi:hypothetical protein